MNSPDYDRSYTKREIVDSYKFFDWLIFLPQDLQQTYDEELPMS